MFTFYHKTLNPKPPHEVRRTTQVTEKELARIQVAKEKAKVACAAAEEGILIPAHLRGSLPHPLARLWVLLKRLVTPLSQL